MMAIVGDNFAIITTKIIYDEEGNLTHENTSEVLYFPHEKLIAENRLDIEMSDLLKLNSMPEGHNVIGLIAYL